MATTPDTLVPAQNAASRVAARFQRLRSPALVAILFAVLIALQGLGYLILGTGRAGMAFSETILVFHNLLAVVCAWVAFRHGRSAAALFWLLFLITLAILLIPTVLIAVDTIFHYAVVPPATWRVLFCFYGTPILMILFLPVSEREGRVRSEVYLDLFQVTLVASLGFYVFFYVPLQGMLPDDALLRNLDLSNLESIFLMVVVLVRLRTVRTRQARDLLLRLGLFVLFCALVTFIGNDIDGYRLATLSAWWDLGWALPYAAGGLVAVSFERRDQGAEDSVSPGFPSFLGTNLMLVALLSAINILTSYWKDGRGTVLTNCVFAVSLLAFALRLALNQFRQHQEIIERKKAQHDLTTANETVANLLDEARVEANASAQISQLASLLQACTSRDEIFRLIPDSLARLFPGTSGTLSVLNPSRTRAALVAEWGTPAGRSLAPGHNAQPSPQSQPQTAIEAIPLMANGEALGVLSIQDDGLPADLPPANAFSRHTQMAYSVAEHIALTIAHIDLREALRSQAVRDPLTGLFNRRYLQESLEREIHRAGRRHRSLSVLMLDIDHFKRYNDTYGHAAGDQALILVGETLSTSVRAEDYACRYGGEEFVVILPECSLLQAGTRAEQIRQRLKDLYTEHEGELPTVITASIGVAAFQEATDRADLLLKRADDALYEAKHEGRDRVVMAASSSVPSPARSSATTAS